MRFALLVYSFATVTALHAEQPFDFGSTPGKLPKQVRPTEYSIWIKPDLKKLTFVGQETVKTHLHSLYRKLDVRDRAGAVGLALRDGIFN